MIYYMFMIHQVLKTASVFDLWFPDYECVGEITVSSNEIPNRNMEASCVNAGTKLYCKDDNIVLYDGTNIYEMKTDN